MRAQRANDPATEWAIRQAQEQAIRKAQLEALDRLPKTLREFIYYAPFNFDPTKVLIRYKTMGAKRTIRYYQQQINADLAMINYQKYNQEG